MALGEERDTGVGPARVQVFDMAAQRFEEWVRLAPVRLSAEQRPRHRQVFDNIIDPLAAAPRTSG